MKHNYFSIIKAAGYLLIGGVLITSVIVQTFFTFILGCAAWFIVLTSMIYNEIKIRKKGEILKSGDYIAQSSDSLENYSSAKIPGQRGNLKGLKEVPVALLQEKNFENSLSHG